ncbi:16889_t:CDS:2, partial [Acaulospora colombiana]
LETNLHGQFDVWVVQSAGQVLWGRYFSGVKLTWKNRLTRIPQASPVLLRMLVECVFRTLRTMSTSSIKARCDIQARVRCVCQVQRKSGSLVGSGFPSQETNKQKRVEVKESGMHDYYVTCARAISSRHFIVHRRASIGGPPKKQTFQDTRENDQKINNLCPSTDGVSYTYPTNSVRVPSSKVSYDQNAREMAVALQEVVAAIRRSPNLLPYHSSPFN